MAVIFPEMPSQLRSAFPAAFWGWWQSLRSWLLTLDGASLPVYANNAAAVAGGLTVGRYYRTGADPDTVCVVH